MQSLNQAGGAMVKASLLSLPSGVLQIRGTGDADGVPNPVI